MSGATRAVHVRAAAGSDLAAVLALLAAADLPVAGVEEAFPDFVIAEIDGRLVGAAGIELHGGHALLRSVIVTAAARGGGVGRALVDAALERARARGARDVYLLTTTAESWFPRLGFLAVDRAGVPAPLLDSVEFRGACPATAAVLMRELDSA